MLKVGLWDWVLKTADFGFGIGEDLGGKVLNKGGLMDVSMGHCLIFDTSKSFFKICAYDADDWERDFVMDLGACVFD